MNSMHARSGWQLTVAVLVILAVCFPKVVLGVIVFTLVSIFLVYVWEDFHGKQSDNSLKQK